MRDEDREIREAIYAGERALGSLRQVQEKLNSARAWGIFDMLGGGMLTGILKHSRINDATRCMENAKYDLQAFQKELRDVRLPDDIRIEVGGFLTFADFFFDGFLADYLVQSKIADARRQVEDAIRRVEWLLDELRRL